GKPQQDETGFVDSGCSRHITGLCIFSYGLTPATVQKEFGDRMERATTTASSLEAEQDSGNINKT
ncbi:hypothetical protein Tco_0284355, partial [Tanacetum coccineum]